MKFSDRLKLFFTRTVEICRTDTPELTLKSWPLKTIVKWDYTGKTYFVTKHKRSTSFFSLLGESIGGFAPPTYIYGKEIKV